MFDPRAFDADVKAVSHLTLVVAVQFLPQKGGDVVWLDAVDGGARQILVNGAQILLPTKDDVRGVFTLIDTPVIMHPQVTKDGTEVLGELVQLLVNPLRPPTIRYLLCLSPISTKALSRNSYSMPCFRSCIASQLCPLK